MQYRARTRTHTHTRSHTTPPRDEGLARKLKAVAAGLSRLLLCCAVPAPLRHAAAARLTLWATKLLDGVLR